MQVDYFNTLQFGGTAGHGLYQGARGRRDTVDEHSIAGFNY
jgi:hypothetical protein